MAKKLTKMERFDSSRKPFRDRKYFLHVKNGEEEKLTKKIKKFGGTIADVLDNVYAVITDDCYAKMYIKRQERDSNTQSSSPTNRGSNTCTPPLTQRTDSAYGTLSSSSRPALPVKTLSATLPTTSSGENSAKSSKNNRFYSKMPSILRQAVDSNVKLTTIDEFTHLVDEFETTLFSKSAKKLVTAPQKIKTEKKIESLTAPFFKFEDEKRSYCPVYKQFLSWPIIYVRSGAKGTPFEQRSPVDDDDVSQSDERCLKMDENGAGVKKQKIVKRTNRQRRKRGDFSGYCDLCRCYAENVNEHINSEFHRRCATSSENYAEFDAIMNAGPSLNEFVSSLMVQPETPNEQPCCSSSSIVQKEFLPERTKTPPPLDRTNADECCTSPIIRPSRQRSLSTIGLTPFRLKRKRIRLVIDEDDIHIPLEND